MARRVMLKRSIGRIALAVALALVFAVPAQAALSNADGIAVPAQAALSSGDGITVLSQHQLSSRLIALTVSTPALKATANIRILLPDGYAANPAKRYPVLYLLHGTSGGAADWTTMGAAEQTTAGKSLIVVMPDIAQNDNGGGWCTDWYNSGAYGQPEWERFHIGELIPWVDHNLRTTVSRQGRAIAGLSQGGFCSMSYAARHPDLFSSALSFSGAPDIAYDAEAQALVTPVINATEVGLDGVAPYSMFGLRQTEEINWAAHDPTTLAANLRHTDLLMYTGNGHPGPLDPLLPNPEADLIESGVEQLTIMFHSRLQALGIPSLFDDYGAGTHSWPYWARDLKWSIATVMADFAHPPATPSEVTYTSADNAYSVYGWSVAMHRQVREFSTLVGANRAGFELQGSGSAQVQTPTTYRRHTRYRITIRGRTNTVNTAAGKRLEIQVPLGPSNTVQEYPADGPPVGTTVYTTKVSIRPAPATPKPKLKPKRPHRQRR
ncbi:MAG TPA: alpha/beta hydrolase family protein [Solirubrobacteraceae bacterium]|jgi:S-formylglutathione hydrolase FrmB